MQDDIVIYRRRTLWPYETVAQGRCSCRV